MFVIDRGDIYCLVFDRGDRGRCNADLISHLGKMRKMAVMILREDGKDGCDDPEGRFERWL